MPSSRPSGPDLTTLLIGVYALALPFDILPLSSGFTATAFAAPVALCGLMLRGCALADWIGSKGSQTVLLATFSLFFWSALTTTWSWDQPASILGLITLLQNLVIFILLAAVASSIDWKVMFWGFALSASIIAASIFRVGAIDSTRATFVGLDPNTVALVLATGASAAVVLLSLRPNLLMTGVLLLIVFATSIAVVMTGSRTGLVAAVLVVLTLPSIGSESGWRKLSFGLVLISASVAGIQFLLRSGRLPERILDFRGVGLAGDSTRSDILVAYFQNSQDWMIFGVGLGADSAFLESSVGWTANAHGLIWKSWVETGLVGLLILLTLLYVVYVRVGRAHVRQVVILSLPLGVFALSLGGMGLNLFWWVCAYALWNSPPVGEFAARPLELADEPTMPLSQARE